MPARHPARPRRFITGTGMTLVLIVLVAVAVSDQGWAFSAAVVGVAGLAMVALHYIFPHGPLFALGVANGLAVYVCLYVVMGRAAFPSALDWARPLGFLIPVAAFVAACWWRRGTLLGVAEGAVAPDLHHLPRFARWLVMTAVVGVVSLSTPINRLPALEQSAALLTAMTVIAGISVASVGDVVRLMVDIASILQMVGRRLRHMALPIATYVSIFALLAVAFGCFYRIADGLSRNALFNGPGGMQRLDFSDALHFSVVTLSTVGYGDIQPIDDGIRLLAAIQMLLGQLLLLFGFAEIMRGSRAFFPELDQTLHPHRRNAAGD